MVTVPDPDHTWFERHVMTGFYGNSPKTPKSDGYDLERRVDDGCGTSSYDPDNPEPVTVVHQQLPIVQNLLKLFPKIKGQIYHILFLQFHD